MPMANGLPTVTGFHDRDLELADGLRVRCSLVLPAGSVRAAPVVLCLHYGGEPHGYYGRALLEGLYEPAWRALGAVMIAPVAEAGDWRTPENGRRALGVLDAIADHYGCTGSPQIVTGYSLGAIGTWHLLAHAPTRFAAAVPIAGPPPAHAPGVTPVRALHATADQLFPAAATRDFVEALGGAGRDAACTLVDGPDHYAFGAFGPALTALLPWLTACMAIARK